MHLHLSGVTEGQYITATLFLITPFLPGDNFWNSEACACYPVRTCLGWKV